MYSCARNGDLCMGLQYMHTTLYQRMTDACLEPKLPSWISLTTLNYTRYVPESRTVIWTAERPYITCSFQVMCVSTHKWLIGKNCNKRLEPELFKHISHLALPQKIDISNCRAVIQYVPCSYTSCSFGVRSVHVSTHKCSIGKRLQYVFGSITHLSFLAYCSNPENRYRISSNRNCGY